MYRQGGCRAARRDSKSFPKSRTAESHRLAGLADSTKFSFALEVRAKVSTAALPAGCEKAL
jgi:hypothetical protein